MRTWPAKFVVSGHVQVDESAIALLLDSDASKYAHVLSVSEHRQSLFSGN